MKARRRNGRRQFPPLQFLVWVALGLIVAGAATASDSGAERSPVAAGDERSPVAAGDERSPVAAGDERSPVAAGDDAGVAGEDSTGIGGEDSTQAPRWSELAAALVDLREGDVSAASVRLARLGRPAILALALILLVATLALSAAIYLPFAGLAWSAGTRGVAVELPKEYAAPGVGPRIFSGEAPKAWRSPLGLGSGLLVTLADDVFGLAAALAVAWVAFGAPEAVFAIDPPARAGVLAMLAGTAAGNLGVLALVFLLYRRRGAGVLAAGLTPVRLDRLVWIGASVAGVLLLLSILHDLAFIALMGREPRSNMAPILEELLMPGSSPLVVAGLIVTVILIAPVVEELVYRGVVYRAFRDRAGVPLALISSGFVFAVAHIEIDHLLPLWSIGVALAWVVERTGSVLPAIAVHMLYNGLSLGVYLLDRLR